MFSFLIRLLKKDIPFLSSFQPLALSIDGSIGLNDASFTQHILFILGSEGQGISHEVRSLFPNIQHIRIPIAANIDSLNVAVSSGILFYAFNFMKNKV